MTIELGPETNKIKEQTKSLKAPRETNQKRYYDELAEAWETIKGFTLNPNNWSKGRPYDG